MYSKDSCSVGLKVGDGSARRSIFCFILCVAIYHWYLVHIGPSLSSSRWRLRAIQGRSKLLDLVQRPKKRRLEDKKNNLARTLLSKTQIVVMFLPQDFLKDVDENVQIQSFIEQHSEPSCLFRISTKWFIGKDLSIQHFHTPPILRLPLCILHLKIGADWDWALRA